MAKKKLLLYANYFYPEVASLSQLYTELFSGLTDKFDITVICAVPCYRGTIEEKYLQKKYYYEEYNGMKIIRVRVSPFSKESKKSRIKHILSYFFNSLSATFKAKKQDVVFTCSQPPVLGGCLGVLGKWITRGKLIYNIQDFNPEQTMAVGYSKNKLVLKAMMFVDKFCCKRSNLVITVGRDMKDNLEKRFDGKKVPNNTVVNNWMDEKEVFPLESTNENLVEFKRKNGLEGKFVIMYSGNIGLFYDWDNIIEVIGRFKHYNDVVFAIIGEGAKRNDIMKYCAENDIANVKFIDYQEKSDLIYSLNAGDVHLVMNARGIKGVSCPSKYYGVAAAGKAIIGVLEEGTEIRMLIEETDGGLVCEPGDYDTIEKNIKWFIDNKDNPELNQMGIRARKYLEKNLTKDVSVQKYAQEIEGLCK